VQAAVPVVTVTDTLGSKQISPSERAFRALPDGGAIAVGPQIGYLFPVGDVQGYLKPERLWRIRQ
jgi:hypothetical protein